MRNLVGGAKIQYIIGEVPLWLGWLMENGYKPEGLNGYPPSWGAGTADSVEPSGKPLKLGTKSVRVA